MGSEVSKQPKSRLTKAKDCPQQSGEKVKKDKRNNCANRNEMPQRSASMNIGRVVQPPIIRVGTSQSSENEFFDSASPGDRLQVDRPTVNRKASSASNRSNSIREKHPINIRYRQLIQACFLNPHEVLGKKIVKRTAESRVDFGKFYVTLTNEMRDELEENIKVLLKKTVANVDFPDETGRIAEEFGERLVQYRSIGFKADFFSNLADATIKECAFLDNAVHPAHQTLSAFSQFITMVFTAVRNGFYGEMRRLRRTSNSFSTGSNSSSRRKKTSVDSGNENPQPSRSTSPSSESRLSDECFPPGVHECEEGFLKPPPLGASR